MELAQAQRFGKHCWRKPLASSASINQQVVEYMLSERTVVP